MFKMHHTHCLHLQKHHVTQPTVPSTKDKLGTSSLSSSAVSTTVPRNDLSSAEPLPPPPGVSVPLTVNQTTTTSSGFTTVTMSGTGKPVSHTSKFTELIYDANLWFVYILLSCYTTTVNTMVFILFSFPLEMRTLHVAFYWHSFFFFNRRTIINFVQPVLFS